MPEWWTYAPSDFLMFSPRTYYRLFELYNAEVWPAHVALLAGGVAVLALMWRGRPALVRVALTLLAACWAWVAWGYLYERFDPINWAARYYAVAFVAQAAILLAVAAFAAPERLPTGAGWTARAGALMMGLALAAYPVLALLFGRPWMQGEVFGLMPDPTAAATLGAVLIARHMSWPAFVVPLLWCAVSGITLWTMGAPDFWILPGMGVSGLLLLAVRRREALR